MSSLQFNAVVTKASKTTRLGVSLSARSRGPHIVSVVASDGLIASSGLVPGTLLTHINNIALKDLSSDQAIALLKDAVGELKLVGTKPEPAMTFLINKSLPTGPGPAAARATTCKMNASTCDSLFGTAKVPNDASRRIYAMVEDEMLPIAFHGYLMHNIFYTEMKSYTVKQMTKGFVGFGTESSHEAQVLMMTSQLATLQRNETLIATQVKDKANAILSKYGIMATYALDTEPLRHYRKSASDNFMISIVGLSFHLIE